MSTGILRLYDNVDLSLIANDQLIYSEVMEYDKDTVDKIFTNLHPHNVTTLNVIVKPVSSTETSSNIVPISTLKKGGKAQVVISKQDMYTINTLASSLGVDNINIYSSLDYYKTLSSERVVVVDDFVNGMLGIAVIETGEILDFITTRPQSLEANLKVMLNKYKTSKIINATTAKSMTLDLSLKLINYNGLDSERKSFLSASLFSLVSEPSLVVKTNDMSFDNIEPPKEGLTKKIIKESKVQEQVDSSAPEDKTVSFWQRIFNKDKKLQDVEFIEESETKAPVLNTAATVCLLLVSILLGTQISFTTEIPKQLEKFSMKYSSLQTEDVKIMEQDVFMDQNLTFLRSGSPYHLNVSELAESIKVNGKLLSIKFHKDKFEVVFALKSEKDIEKFNKSAQEKFNVLDYKNYGTVTMGKEKFVKVSVLCN